MDKIQFNRLRCIENIGFTSPQRDTISQIWLNFCSNSGIMSIEEINRKHYFKTDMYYRVGYGLSSRLLAFRNGIIYLQVVIGRKWDKDYHATTLELAHCWRAEHEELQQALGCKVFIIDANKYPYKQDLLQLKIQVNYDARMGMLFSSNVLN